MILPLHPHPFEDELLTSWMVRLSFANGFFLHTFYNKVLNYKLPIWNRDVDRYSPAELFNLLAGVTGQSYKRLEMLTFTEYECFLYNKVTINGNSRWIMPLGIYHRKRKRFGMQFCPVCLKENIYYRKKWRLALFAICEKHKCLLYEDCPNCGAPISFHRLGMGIKDDIIPNENIGKCFSCSVDFKEVLAVYPQGIKISLLDNYAKFLYSFLEKRQIILNKSNINGVDFYNGVRFIISAIIGRYGEKLRNEILIKTEIDLNKINHEKLVGFEYLPNNERLNIMAVVSWVVSDWPYNFVRVFKKVRFTKSNFTDYQISMPFWLSRVIKSID